MDFLWFVVIFGGVAAGAWIIWKGMKDSNTSDTPGSSRPRKGGGSKPNDSIDPGKKH